MHQNDTIMKLIEMLVQNSQSPSQPQEPEHKQLVDSMIGKWVTVRSHMAGCFAGIMTAAKYNETIDRYIVTLSPSRQLWGWWAKDGVGLAGVAASGLRECNELRIGATVNVPQVIVDVIQLTTMSDVAIESVLAAKVTQS